MIKKDDRQVPPMFMAVITLRHGPEIAERYQDEMYRKKGKTWLENLEANYVRVLEDDLPPMLGRNVTSFNERYKRLGKIGGGAGKHYRRRKKNGEVKRRKSR